MLNDDMGWGLLGDRACIITMLCFETKIKRGFAGDVNNYHGLETQKITPPLEVPKTLPRYYIWAHLNRQY